MVRIFALGLFAVIGIFAETDTEKQTPPCGPHSAGYPACNVAYEIQRRLQEITQGNIDAARRIGHHVIVKGRAHEEHQFVREVAEQVGAQIININVPALCASNAPDLDVHIRNIFKEASGTTPVIIFIQDFDAAVTVPEHMTASAHTVKATIRRLIAGDGSETGLDGRINVVVAIDGWEKMDGLTKSMLCGNTITLAEPVTFEQFKAILQVKDLSSVPSEEEWHIAYRHARGLVPGEVKNLIETAGDCPHNLDSYIPIFSEAQRRQAPFQACIARILSMRASDAIYYTVVAGFCVLVGRECYKYMKLGRDEKPA